MSILDVTEDQIFQTLGKGKDPNFKPIEKVRPVIAKPKKTYTSNQSVKTTPPVKAVKPVEPVIEPVKTVQPIHEDDSIMKLSEEMNELNERMNGLQKMIKYYIVPQFIVVLILVLVLVVKA